MLKFRTGFFALGLLCTTPVLGLAETSQTQFTVLDVAIEQAGTYVVSMWVPFGSTSDSVPGIAHVMEHLKFKADDGHGFVAFDAIPGSSANASTTYRYTRFDLSVPPAGLIKAMQSLADMTKPLKVTEADLQTEKKVVQQELLQRTQSDPDTQFYSDFYSELFKGLPLERPPGGTLADVEKVEMTDVLAFDAKHYQGTRAFVQIIGPVLNDEQKKAVATIFANPTKGAILVDHKFNVSHADKNLIPLPAFLPPLDPVSIEPAQFERSKISDRARGVKLSVSKIIAAPTPWSAVAAASVLQDAIRSRLPVGLRDKIADDANLVQSWSVSIDRLVDGVWQLNFSATVQNGVDQTVVQKTFENYLSDFAKTGMNATDFDRLRKRYFLTSEWENAGNHAMSIGANTVNAGYKIASSFLDQINDLKLDDVNSLLVVLNKPGRVGVAIVNPKGAAQ